MRLIPSEESRNRLVRDHSEFADYVDMARHSSLGPDDLEKAGRLLHDHIRWEERTLFPLIEKTATVAQLEDLASRTAVLEARRANSDWSPRRGELMRNPSVGSDTQDLRAIERWVQESGRDAEIPC